MTYVPQLFALPTPEPGELDAFWRQIDDLGIHSLVRLADGVDFIGETSEGEYVRVPDPSRHDVSALRRALIGLTVRCLKLDH